MRAFIKLGTQYLALFWRKLVSALRRKPEPKPEPKPALVGVVFDNIDADVARQYLAGQYMRIGLAVATAKAYRLPVVTLPMVRA